MEITFQQHPEVTFATNRFIRVPIILQYEDTPLLEVVNTVDAGYSTQFPVYAADGIKVAVVRGTRIIPTAEGKSANVTKREEQNLVVCELEGTPILELRRTGPHSLNGWAEMYAPEGVLIKANDTETAATFRTANDQPLVIRGMTIRHNTFEGVRVGIHITRNGIGLGGM